MLLIHPVEEILKLFPVLIGSVLLGSSSGNPYWGLGVAGLLVLVGLARWFTTSYRIGPVHVELRRGLLRRRELSVPRSRIRSVDVDRRVLHRLLGLAVVKIGTGQSGGSATDHNRFELNGIAIEDVPALRTGLLEGGLDAAAPEGMAVRASVDSVRAPMGTAPSERELARFRSGWVRYAPFSATGLIGIAAVVGLAFQYGIGEQLTESDTVARGVDALAAAGIAVVVGVAVVVMLVVASIAACIRYLLLYGNLLVTDDGRMLRVGRGLLRVRHTTLDRARLRGVDVHEPVALRLVGAARLDAIMTGVSAERGESSLVLPSAPDGEVRRVAGAVLTTDSPLTVPLVPHGAAARRRRFTRAIVPVVCLVAAGIAVTTILDRPLPLPATTAGTVVLVVAAAALGWDRYRGLGHASPAGYLVTRSGSLDRHRVCLESDGIIGWTVRQTFFQRRAGVATVIAATPAGAGHYEVVDVPESDAWALIESVTPGAGDIWTRGGQSS
ncbi:PH domain-containing protein [Rhodococcus sp. SJ-2]